MARVTGRAVYIRDEQVEYKRAVSENLLTDVASTNNYVLDNFLYYEFGVTGAAFSGLSAYPYTFSQDQEIVQVASTILSVKVFIENAGSASSTIFKIERQLAAGGSWDNIFSTNCEIGNNAADELFFNTSSSGISNVTVPVLSITDLGAGDRLRFVIVQAATGAYNLRVKVIYEHDEV